MKIIVAGPRDFKNKNTVYNGISLVLQRLKDTYGELNNLEIVQGGANGVDALALQYAQENHIPYKTFNADWNKYNRAAGPIRNEQMAKYGEVLIAFKNQEHPTRGTENMIKTASKYNLKIFVVPIKSN